MNAASECNFVILLPDEDWTFPELSCIKKRMAVLYIGRIKTNVGMSKL
jgi:hypothetical protein